MRAWWYNETRLVDYMGTWQKRITLLRRSLSSKNHFPLKISSSSSCNRILKIIFAYSRLRRRIDMSPFVIAFKLESQSIHDKCNSANRFFNTSRHQSLLTCKYEFILNLQERSESILNSSEITGSEIPK